MCTSAFTYGRGICICKRRGRNITYAIATVPICFCVKEMKDKTSLGVEFKSNPPQLHIQRHIHTPWKTKACNKTSISSVATAHASKKARTFPKFF